LSFLDFTLLNYELSQGQPFPKNYFKITKCFFISYKVHKMFIESFQKNKLYFLVICSTIVIIRVLFQKGINMRKITLITIMVIFVLINSFYFSSKDTIRVGKEHVTLDRVNLREDLPKSLQVNNELINLEETITKIKETQFEIPTEWGETVRGVIQKIETDEKIIALTFDACGGEWGSDYDEPLINFLIAENIPATLFINSRWIDTNLDTFLYLSSLEQFQIENHGTEHRPLSITGRTAWGIKGTTSIEEVIAEVVTNYEKIKTLTGHSPRYFRSGTAFYDEIAVQIVEQLGMNIVNYDILGDAGATYSPNQVRDALLKSKPGSIALLHMNQPTKGTADGVKMAIPLLKEQGFTFVTISEAMNNY
jgi:peptidoglycan/xylan/chitin deacetylase (PgdA/CDA1 family)